MSIAINRKVNVPQPALNGRTLSLAFQALTLSRSKPGALAPKNLVNTEVDDDKRNSVASSSTFVEKTASKSKNLSWIPPQGAMLAKLQGGATYWVEWKRVAGQGNGWKISGFVYIYAKGKKQPSSKMAFDANKSLITKDGRLIVILANSQTQIEGTRKVNQTASAKIYYEFYSLYNRIKAGRAEKHRLVSNKKKTNVTLASADLFLFLQKNKKDVKAKSQLGSWLRKCLAQLMKAKNLGGFVPKSVRLAVEASGLDMKLFGLKPTPVRGRKLAENIHGVLYNIDFMNYEFDQLLLRRFRNAFGADRLGISDDELDRMQRAFERDLQIGVQDRHPYNGILIMLHDLLVRPGFIADGRVPDEIQDDLRQLLWEMVQAAVDGVNLDGYREEMQELVEGLAGEGDRADAIVNAIFDLNIFVPSRTRRRLDNAAAAFLNANIARIGAGFDETVGAAHHLINFQGRGY